MEEPLIDREGDREGGGGGGTGSGAAWREAEKRAGGHRPGEHDVAASSSTSDDSDKSAAVLFPIPEDGSDRPGHDGEITLVERAITAPPSGGLSPGARLRLLHVLVSDGLHARPFAVSLKTEQALWWYEYTHARSRVGSLGFSR